MTTVTEDLDLPDGTDPSSVSVALQLWGDGAAVTGYEQTTMKTIGGVARTSGTPWSITGVVGNSAIDAPVGTVYKLTRTWPGLRDPLVDYLSVPATGGPYRVDQILTDPPAAVTSSALSLHAVDTALHGAGQELFCVESGNNFGPSGVGTTWLDVTGLSATVTIPSRPFVLEVDLPVIILPAATTAWADARLVFGATPTQLTANKRLGQAVEASVLEKILHLPLKCRVPNLLHTPTPGSQVTYKVQFRGSAANNPGVTEFSVAPNPFGQVDLVQFRGYTT